jgi:hypothetical protein
VRSWACGGDGSSAMTLFRKKLHEPQFPDPTTGGIDPALWRLLVRAVTAVSNDDAERFLKTIRVIADRHSLASQRLFGYYAYFMLKNSLTSLVGAAPAHADLGEVARRIEPRFLRFLPDGASELYPVLLAPFNLVADEDGMTGFRYTMCALVAVSALLEDGERDLQRAKPVLDVWCTRGAGTIRRVCEAPPEPS